MLQDLPQLPIADDAAVLFFIERHRLMGRGIGYVDNHLLAATVGVRWWAKTPSTTTG